MGLSLGPHDCLWRETCKSHLAHNHLPAPPCRLSIMFLLLGDPQAQPSSSRPWDHKKVLEAAAIPSDCPVKLPGTPGLSSWGGGRPWSTPSLLTSCPLPRRECVGPSQREQCQDRAGRWREGCRRWCSQDGGAFVRTERSLILSATREGGCGWQVKSCLENPGRKVSRMPE